MDILIILVIWYAGYLVGNAMANLKFAREIKNAAEAVGIDLEKEFALKEKQANVVHKLAIEKHGEILYLFDKEQDNFICQANTVQELAKLAKQYKNIIHAAVMYENTIYQFKDGEAIEVL